MRWPIATSSSALLLCLTAVLLASLTMGPVSLPTLDSLLAVWDQLVGREQQRLANYQHVVIMDLRLPRSLLAIMIGAMLAQCGAVTQGLFRNPLADPGIIGVSSGAAVGAILCIVLLPATITTWAVPVSSFAGGLLTTLLVYGLAQTRSGTSVLVLLLAGVAISAFAGAFIGFASYFADDQDLRALSLWQMGSLTAASEQQLWLAFVTLLALAGYFQYHATALNTLLLGEAEARHLGIRVERLKFQLIVVSAIGVGIAVACAGIIGFVGLVVPHLVRMSTGPNHHSLLPLCALCGALLLLVADVISRLLVAPAELPVGLVTALLGAPFFLILLIQQRQQW